MSSTFPGWSLLPSTVIIVLALVNSTMSPVGTSSISMRPRSVALLPVSTTSTGLLHLSVGAHVHCVRSDTEKYHMWPPLCTHHFQCVTILGIPGWTVGTSGKGNTLLHQRVFPLDPYVYMQADVAHATVHLGGKDGLG